LFRRERYPDAMSLNTVTSLSASCRSSEQPAAIDQDHARRSTDWAVSSAV